MPSWDRAQQAGAPAAAALTIDRSNQLGARVVQLFQMNGTNRELKTGTSMTLSGGSYVPTSRSGLALKAPGGVATALCGVDLSSYSAITLGFWLNWDSFANNDAMAFEHNASYSTIGFYVDPNTANGRFSVVCSDPSNNGPAKSFTRPSAAEWHYYVVPIDRMQAGAFPYVMVDGVKQALTVDATSTPGNNFVNSTLDFFSRTSSTLFGAGQLKDFAILAGALSETEALALSARPGQLYRRTRRRRGLAWATIQYLRPVTDIAAGTWAPSSGGTLAPMVDEAIADDSDYVTTNAAGTAEVKLSTGSSPGVTTGHVINYRAKGAGTLTVSLVQGTTVIASHSPALGSAYQAFTLTLTAGQAGAITDYSDLRLRFVAA